MTLTASVEHALTERRRKDRAERMTRTLLHALADQVYAAVFSRAPKEQINELLKDMRQLIGEN